jgi:hypothetical protein
VPVAELNIAVVELPGAPVAKPYCVRIPLAQGLDRRLVQLVADGPTSVSLNAVAATLNLGGLTPHANAAIAAKIPGVDGNLFTFALASDGSGVGSLVKTGNAYVFHFAPTVTTEANLETAIASSPDLVVATPGTGTNVLQSGDVLVATALAGGSGMTVASLTVNPLNCQRVTLRLTNADNVQQLVDVDGPTTLTCRLVPYVAIDLIRVSGQATTVELVLGMLLAT